MFLLATVLLFGLASAQKVTDMTSCSTDTNQLRIDCKYEPAEEGTVCKYTQGDRELGATNVPKDAANKNRDTVSLVDKNNCQLILNNLPDGKNNFTCSIEQKETASMSTMVEKSELAGKRKTEIGGFIALMQSSVQGCLLSVFSARLITWLKKTQSA
uniref:Uncharacterized protein n=1 Tax=Gadus morhua TaxID=8049 RepID=A0A8C5A7Y2_GADMO